MSGGGFRDSRRIALDLLVSWKVGGNPPVSLEKRATMEEERRSYLYQRFTITTLRHEGVWWAKARVALKDVGGDRSVLGGPWRTQVEAEAAAEVFCDSRKAG